MNLRIIHPLIFVWFVSSCTVFKSKKNTQIAEEQPAVKCTENSPERRGEEGCTILANRPLLESPTKTLYWHIDRFDSLEAAKKAAGPDGVAVEAHGAAWLMTVEAKAEEHQGGYHVTWIGPLVLPVADRYTMRVQSSLLKPGSITPVHRHSGPEVIYIVDGEQCMETMEVGQRLGAGQSYLVQSGGVHRGRVTGAGIRRALALILYDAAHPASHDLVDPPPLAQCK
jgi:quercetin dioxygenase-like cupin family protein